MRNGEYTLVVAPDNYPGKKYRGSFCYEHHLVWWQNTGQVINDGEIVHHKNENKKDNDFGNLELMTNPEHSRKHALERERVTVHGTHVAYQKHGCRCNLCREHHNQSIRDYRSRNK